MTPNEFSIERIFLILRRRAWLIVNTFAVAVVIAGAITYQTPKMYKATSSLYFDFSGNNPFDSRGRSILAEDSYLTTQVGILESLNVAQRVVDGLTDYERERVIAALKASHSPLDKFIGGVRKFVKSIFIGEKHPETGASSEESPPPGDEVSTSPARAQYDWLAKSIGRGLEIYPQVNSRIVEVSYLSTDPRIAALLADMFAEAYIATNLQMVIDPARKSKLWFDEQLKSLRNRLESAQQKLTAYQQREGIVSTDQRIDIETAKLRSLADRLVTAQEATRNAETERMKLQEVLNRGVSLETFEPVFSNALVQKIKSEIRGLEGKLVESSSTLGENHPRIKRLKSELAAAKRRLRKEIRTITDGINNAAELARERERALEQAMKKQKELVLKLKSEHDKIVVLQREVDSAQASYNAALKELNTTNMRSMVDQTNVSVVDHASIPGNHATPRLTLNLAVGAFGGLLLGIGLALFLEIFARRVHSEEDIVADIGIPLLGHLRKY